MKLNSSLTRMDRLRKKHSKLIREISTSWNTKIPRNASLQILETTRGYLVNDLNVDMPSTLGFKAFIDEAKFRAAPAKHETAQSYVKSAILANVFGKISLLIEGNDPQAVAEARFYDAEERCKRANQRLRYYRNHDFAIRPLMKRLDVHQVFHLARRKISKWLADYDPADILEHSRHGPGGCGGEKEQKVKRPFSTPYFKFAKTPQGVSKGAYFLYLRAIVQNDAWVRAIAQDLCSSNVEPNLSVMSFENRVQLADTILEIARGNDVGFVLKTFSTHRAISSEPQGNVYVQLGIGSIFRDALKAAGCDLNDQSRNQSLAYAGSIEEDDSHRPSTVDVEMASDCECIELVRELFEPKWFELMDAVRSHDGRFKGEWFKWEKFSSMGNGFTFELESMIFYALAQACCDLSGETDWFSDTFGPRYKYGQLSVYGDDIIVPRGCVEHLIQVLRFCGFRTNIDKTFIDGPFRESCGSDWFNGTPVRAAYYKGDLSRIKDIVKLLNVVKYNSELLKSVGCEALDRTYEYLRTLLSVIAPTVSAHLRNTQKTLSWAYIWCEPDEVHQSKLVSWDTDMQSWLMPEIRSKLEEWDGRARWRYVQFLYAATGNRDPLPPDEYENLVLINPLAASLTAGGSGGDIMLAARAGDGRLDFVSRCEALSDLDRAFITCVQKRSLLEYSETESIAERLVAFKAAKAVNDNNNNSIYGSDGS
ncbi:TPA_asm: RNA-directed RNA polymerase [ssRNA phage SRR6960799_29]|uniref:RNA-directed RNA polymerase n=1 Tax=ssRNA phage SRR6960799_29 TaxID=2786586 RepID=A0A8S5L4D2_9VIRU|nr:RNA-directed RNA polymerase [ssRNA phage SRR6960799_29]DAD52276.1 TPA_asm: RNA-directed RNA polymerase [ssRNA phage SRR6960799_29]